MQDPGPTHDDGALARIAEKIETLTAWYAEQIHAERRCPDPDPDRVQHLLAERAACTTTLRDLPHATAAQLARIEADYDVRLGEITGE
ncbi:hypothetical protein [Kitasatospora sp. NPDC094015]|uniref:hypothetical protein n=1 Tax=Kitasatospora sp. NPDC094015 TaxID=3155205 RepID=UPI003323D2AF